MDSRVRARSHDFGASQRRAAVVKYVENNRISSIFQHLLSQLIVEKPANPQAFMVQELEKMREENWSPKVGTRRAFSETDMKKHMPPKPSATTMTHSLPNKSGPPVFITTLPTASQSAPVNTAVNSTSQQEKPTHSKPPSSSSLTVSMPNGTGSSELHQTASPKLGSSLSSSPATRSKVPALRPLSPKLSNALSAALSPTSSSTPPLSPIRETSKITKQHTDDGKTKVNQYILYNNLGSGTYGTVKLGVDSITSESYAIKVLRKSRLKRIRTLAPGKVEDMLMNVRHEIALMKKLQHENVVQLYEVLDDPTQDKLFMVLEYVKGGPVMRIEAGKTTAPMNPDNVWKYFRDIIKGLDYLHAQKVVHRDIKPENLLVTADGVVKISDFGVSFMFEGEDDNLRKTTGTPAFLAPEICSGSKDLYSGRAVDIWAAGITLYCFVFGAVPFMANTIMQIYEKITTEPLVFSSPCGPQLQDLLEKMLEKDPHRRITLQGIKEHPWVTKNGQFEISDQPREVIVTEQDVDGAIRQINKIAVLVKAKHFVRVLRERRSSLPEIPRFHRPGRSSDSSSNLLSSGPLLPATPENAAPPPFKDVETTPASVAPGLQKVTPLLLAETKSTSRTRSQSTSRVRTLYKSKSFDVSKLKANKMAQLLEQPLAPLIITPLISISASPQRGRQSPSGSSTASGTHPRLPIQRSSTVLM